MAKAQEGRIQHGRVTGIETMMQYPTGFVDLEYRVYRNGEKTDEQQTLRLLLTSEEALQVAAQFHRLHASIEEYGGKPQ